MAAAKKGQSKVLNPSFINWVQLFLRLGEALFLFFMMAASARVVHLGGPSKYTHGAMFGLAVAMTGLGVVALYIFGPKSKRLWRALPGMTDILLSGAYAVACLALFGWMVGYGACPRLTKTYNPPPAVPAGLMPGLAGIDPALVAAAGLGGAAGLDASLAGLGGAAGAGNGLNAGAGGLGGGLNAGAGGLGVSASGALGNGLGLGGAGSPALGGGLGGLGAAAPMPAAAGNNGGALSAAQRAQLGVLPGGNGGAAGLNDPLGLTTGGGPSSLGLGLGLGAGPAAAAPRGAVPAAPVAFSAPARAAAGGGNGFALGGFGAPAAAAAPVARAAPAPRADIDDRASGIANPFGRRRLLGFVPLKGGKQGVCGAFNFVGATAFLNALLFALSAALAGYDLSQGKGWVGADGEIRALPTSAPPSRAASSGDLAEAVAAKAAAGAAAAKAAKAADGSGSASPKITAGDAAGGGAASPASSGSPTASAAGSAGAR